MLPTGFARPVVELIEHLKMLPGIGEKSATRLAFHILKAERGEVEGLSRALLEVKNTISLCRVCYNLTDRDPCAICADPRREPAQVCVVEEPADLLAVERIGQYRGKYHVLHGVLSPLDGIGPEDIRVEELVQRIKGQQVAEVILALNPSTEGETTSIYLAKILQPLGVKITRIAYGIPMGGDLKYTDDMTLMRAIESRRELE
ncbi:MAG: recombination protein RecR [Deltaproteobacteria bacterium]|nr:recombination protein RecR [Deltaproteobacteria bacterium]